MKLNTAFLFLTIINSSFISFANTIGYYTGWLDEFYSLYKAINVIDEKL